jgi:hypothetical protein
VTPIGEPEKFGPVGIKRGIVRIRQLHVTGLNQARRFNQALRFVTDWSNAKNPTADTSSDFGLKRMPGPGPFDQNDVGAMSIGQLDRGGPQCRINNRAENLHQPFRRRKEAIARFRYIKALKKIASASALIQNLSTIIAISTAALSSRKPGQRSWLNGI